ncbi:hypothetical protein CHS0354_017167 [Potamilus streckersoni]|uniref:HAT C-terminal dimerisation domain-containing protein n=1 Tax=Potamilus streckersoni TaxID=2493646 RepID=A0AAE0T2U5_9BIVA|nr:hypothetical protein CHS0354_017167 [Potamilus streckersoni]
MVSPAVSVSHSFRGLGYVFSWFDQTFACGREMPMYDPFAITSATPTITMTLPLKHRIIYAIEVQEINSSLVKSVKLAVSQDRDTIYNDKDTQLFLLQICALYPRFRSLTCIDDATGIQVYASSIMQAFKVHEYEIVVRVKQIDKCAEVHVLSSVLSTQPQLPSVLEVSKRDNTPAAIAKAAFDKSLLTRATLKDLLGDVYVIMVESSKSIIQRAHAEITRSRTEAPISHVGDDPLTWWKLHETSFPLLCHPKESFLVLEM